jgi:hypothetical protein
VAVVFDGRRLRVVAGIAAASIAAGCGAGEGDDALPGHVVGGEMPYRVDVDAQPVTASWAVEVRHSDDQWCASNLVFMGKPIGQGEPRCAESANTGATPAIELGHHGGTRFFVIFAEGLTQTGIDPGTAGLDHPPTDHDVINADQNGPVILVVSESVRPGQEIVVEDDDGHQTAIPLPG